jgi:hypothetical protein
MIGRLKIGRLKRSILASLADVIPAQSSDEDRCGKCQARRRRLAYPCIDWSERRPHLGGALGAALLECLERRKWVEGDPGSRALSMSRAGSRELRASLGVSLE